MKKKKKTTETSTKIVECWKCHMGLMVRKQGQAQGEFPVCTKAKLIILNPSNPPKSCPYVKERED